MYGESKNGIEMRQMMDAMNNFLIPVRHMVNTSQYKPIGYDSWKEFWEAKMKPLKFPSTVEKCACCNIDTHPEDFVGSHIQEETSHKTYIYPLCKFCNDKYGKGKEESPIFNVKKALCVDFSPSEAEIVRSEE